MRLFSEVCILLLSLSLAWATPKLDNVPVKNLAKDEEYRLPTNIVPSHYALELTIDPSNNTFDGLVAITIIGTKVNDTSIKLHASPKYITISEATLDLKTKCIVIDTNNITEIVTIDCPKTTLNGESKLYIQYTGTFSTEDMHGVYKSTYEEDGKEHVLVATQCEPFYARRVFPSFDEPSFKATYEITITHPSKYSALGNTPSSTNVTATGDKTQTKFDTTPKLSTYLIAFVVSEFEASLSKAVATYYDFNIYTRHSAKEFTTVSTTYAPLLIQELGDWTGIRYDRLGNKQAFEVAIPDFAPGAMENWGLINFKEIYLLDEGNKTSRVAKQNIITTIAHEVTHQWFGDYVTTDWWSDIWLNEGFATYFEYFIPDQLSGDSDPEFEFVNQFVVKVLQRVLKEDALTSSSPLSSKESEINTPIEDDNKFDDISYDKGASILRMIRNILGEKAFQTGLREYLKQYKYDNPSASDLLIALQNATNYSSNLTEVLDSWVFNAGYPLLTVKLLSNKTGVHIMQERFIISNDNETDSDTQWYVPISYTTSGDKDFSVNIKGWLEPDSMYMTDDLPEDGWIILNTQQIGFFRINYDDELWDRIITALKDDKERSAIHKLNRAQLVDDIFNIARTGLVDYETAFNLADYLSGETDYFPWVSALNAITYLTGKLGDDYAEYLLREQTLKWINTSFPDAEVKVKTHVDGLKQSLILDWACKLGLDSCIKYALETFANYKKSSSLPDYNNRGTVFCYALRNSTNVKEDYKFLFSVLENSTSSIEQNAILSALGCASDVSVINTYLGETIAKNSSIRKQDAPAVFQSIYANGGEVGVNTTLDFLIKNIKKITETYPSLGLTTSIIGGLGDKIYKEGQIEKFNQIIKTSENDNVKTVGAEALVTINNNLNFAKTYGEEIRDLLVDRSTGGANIARPAYLLSIMISIIVLYISYF